MALWNQGGRALLKGIIAIAILFMLVGCSHDLEREASSNAREAMIAGDFERGSLLLLAGCDRLHEQSIYLLRMLNYSRTDNTSGMFLAWLYLMRVESDEDFVRVAAFQVLQQAMNSRSN